MNVIGDSPVITNPALYFTGVFLKVIGVVLLAVGLFLMCRLFLEGSSGSSGWSGRSSDSVSSHRTFRDTDRISRPSGTSVTKSDRIK